MEIWMLAVIAVNIVGALIFWKRDQNKVYSILVLSLLFLFGTTIINDYKQEWKDYQTEYYRLVAEGVNDFETKAAILNTSLKIKQIWNSDLGVADRCTTCHMGYDNPTMKEAPNPYKYHASVRQHDFNDIGCVICHQGQGRATDKEHAHADHVLHWETPILPISMSESSCSKCHSESKLEEGETTSLGKELFIKMGCHGCHKVKGYDNLYKVATSLKGVAHKINPAWLIKWVQNPKDYLPQTGMPNFRLSEEDAVSVAAYIISQTDASFKPRVKFSGGDPIKGKRLFREVGCLGCHALEGKGASWASDLGKVGGKVKADWLVSWTLDPRSYDSNTRMPKFRLSVKDANDITAFLMLLGNKQDNFKYENEMSSPEKIKEGKQIVQARGCSACHEINGVPESRIGPELSKIGAKDEHHLDFGDSHGIEHTWEAWVKNKLKEPTVYDTDVIKSNMPTFNLSDKEINALAVFLKGLDGFTVPSNFLRRLSVKEFEIEEGSKLITKFNCRGCHLISGVGGQISKFYKGKFNSPPPLEMGDLHVGDRIKDSWLFSFLRNPGPVREWLKVRMPTYDFKQDEIYYITRYFVNFGEDEIPYEQRVKEIVPDEYLKEGRKLLLTFECLDCHDGSRGPKLGIVSERVRGEWAKRWLKNTRKIYPGTKMPDHWPVKNGKHVVSSKYSRAKSLMGGDVDKQIDAIWAYISNYKERPFLDIELAEEDDDEED